LEKEHNIIDDSKTFQDALYFFFEIITYELTERIQKFFEY